MVRFFVRRESMKKVGSWMKARARDLGSLDSGVDWRSPVERLGRIVSRRAEVVTTRSSIS